MGQQITNQTLFTEIFPIALAALPELSAYRLDVRGDYSLIGGKLAYRLMKAFDGHWTWAGGLIVTDTPQEVSEIMNVVNRIPNGLS